MFAPNENTTGSSQQHYHQITSSAAVAATTTTTTAAEVPAAVPAAAALSPPTTTATTTTTVSEELLAVASVDTTTYVILCNDVEESAFEPEPYNANNFRQKTALARTVACSRAITTGLATVASTAMATGWLLFQLLLRRTTLPASSPLVATVLKCSAAVGIACLLAWKVPTPELPVVSVAFIGNSMMYYNDLPRFMEALSDGHMIQDSCLHGDANLRNILVTGNGMYNIWSTGSARVYSDDQRIFDYGACTVAQLLFGYDANLESRMSNGVNAENFVYNDDFTNFNDGKNPCLQTEYYYEYLQSKYDESPPVYDYVIINDNTRSPSRKATRTAILEVLSYYWVPMLNDTGAVPILVSTYGYWTPYRDMGGLDTVPYFTSLTYEGYREYAQLLEDYLPSAQKPRIAPVGQVFLMVWEENYNLWQQLFHVDKIHTSPMGTFLQGLAIYHTIYGTMPPFNIAVRPDMSYLWMRARRFQPGDHRRSPFPTQEQAAYLYNVVVRVCERGQVPKTFIEYRNGEAADYLPQDDLYRVDDLF